MHPTERFCAAAARTLILAASLTVAPLLALPLAAQAPDPLALQVRTWHRAHAQQVLTEFREFLAMPNVASDSVQIRRTADALAAMLGKRGVRARRLESPGSPPAVYGELLTPGATRTVMLYAHYDGGLGTLAEWKIPGTCGIVSRAMPLARWGSAFDSMIVHRESVGDSTWGGFACAGSLGLLSVH